MLDDLTVQRFWGKVDKRGPDDCWPWKGSVPRYGQIIIDDKAISAHRASVIADGREIPKGMQVDHLCRNKWCVNPAHLEVVTSRENTLRGNGPTAQNSAKTHCHRGHAFAGRNCISRKSHPTERQCRECTNIMQRARRKAARISKGVLSNG